MVKVAHAVSIQHVVLALAQRTNTILVVVMQQYKYNQNTNKKRIGDCQSACRTSCAPGLSTSEVVKQICNQTLESTAEVERGGDKQLPAILL